MYIDHRILLVDDDPDDRIFIEEALKETHSKYKILTATDGVEALSVIGELINKGELPCLIILDINMPRMDGRETLERIKANAKTRRVPVVIFSTADKNHLEDFYTDHGVQYFTKPIEHGRFCKTVHRFLAVCEHASTKSSR